MNFVVRQYYWNSTRLVEGAGVYTIFWLFAKCDKLRVLIANKMRKNKITHEISFCMKLLNGLKVIFSKFPVGNDGEF